MCIKNILTASNSASVNTFPFITRPFLVIEIFRKYFKENLKGSIRSTTNGKAKAIDFT